VRLSPTCHTHVRRAADGDGAERRRVVRRREVSVSLVRTFFTAGGELRNERRPWRRTLCGTPTRWSRRSTASSRTGCSKFYRFSAEYVLALVDDEYDPSTFNYRELKDELELDDQPRLLGADGGRDFLDAVITIRQYGLRSDFEAAETYIDENYDATDRPGMILEELLRVYRDRVDENGPDGGV